MGLDNYQQALQDSQFWGGVARVGLFLLVQVPVMLGIALLVALALDSGRLYGKDFFRISVFLPYAVPAVVASLMWGFMYGTRFGLVGDINDAFGISLPDPLSSGLILASIGNIVTWEFVGYNMLIFYSALRVVPHSSTRRPRSTARASGASYRRSSCRRYAAPSSSPRSSRSSAASSCSTSPRFSRSSRPTTSPPTTPRTTTRTRCPSPANSTTTPRPSPSSWA